MFSNATPGASYGTLGDSYGVGLPFDHSELWGRDGVPLVFIGHPYGIREDARKTLDAIRGLGLVVSDYHSSWYGTGTVQVRVYHAVDTEAVTFARPSTRSHGMSTPAVERAEYDHIHTVRPLDQAELDQRKRSGWGSWSTRCVGRTGKASLTRPTRSRGIHEWMQIQP